MQSIPPELHAHIVRLACTDGPSLYTYHALSLVSTYFAELSRPWRFYTISVHGLTRMSELLSALEATSENLRRVRHLHVSDTPRGIAHAHDNCHAKMTAALLRLLSLVAPTLHTLAIATQCTLTSTTHLAHLFSAHLRFPFLREVSIWGFYAFPSGAAAEAMPNLRRLSLGGVRNPFGLLTLGRIPDAFPFLTHLRISSLHLAATFVGEMQSALDLPSALRPQQRTVLPRPRLSPSLKYLVVQAGVSTMGAKLKDDVMMEDLHELVRAQEQHIKHHSSRERTPVLILLPRSSGKEQELEDIEKMWMTRITDRCT